MQGMLEKRRPDGLGLMWQTRFFTLDRQHLRYFRSAADTRSHAQLGQIELKHVIAVQGDAGSPEFVVVTANSQRAPYTLRSETPDEAAGWVSAIEIHSPRIRMMKRGGGSGSASTAGLDEIQEGDDDEEDGDPLAMAPSSRSSAGTRMVRAAGRVEDIDDE